MNDSTLDELLDDRPGNGITVDRDDEGVYIRIEGKYTWTAKAIFQLVGMGCGGMMFMMIVGTVIVANLGLDPFWTQILVMMPLIVPATIFAGRFIASQMPAEVQLSEEGVEIYFRNQTTSLDWDEIRSVRPVYMRKAGTQLYPDLDKPYRKGSGDGVAFETPHGEFRHLSYWHDAVCEWLANVINTFAVENSIQLREPVNSEVKPVPPEFPSKIQRKDLLKIGLLAIPMAAFFFYGSAKIAYEASTVGSWQQTKGKVVTSRDGEQPGRVIEYVIEYEYEVEGKIF